MDRDTAAYLLREYPFLWRQKQMATVIREKILQKYKSSSDYKDIGCKGTDISDKTGQRAMELYALTQGKSLGPLITIAGQWINEELKPIERPVLLYLWRCQAVYGLEQAKVMLWQAMIERFFHYVMHYAGHVRGEHGTAFVSGHSKSQ